MKVFLIVLFVIFFIIITIASYYSEKSDHPQNRPFVFEPPERRYGIIGERKAANIISSVLRKDDLLFTNVQVEYEGKRTELDSVIVNRYGVFIIEVKNYKGIIVGSEDDSEWTKYHTTDAGNTYSKEVRNPINQVRRQIYILAKYLESRGPRVWVRGYALLLQKNSPVESEYILSSLGDIDRAIHTPDRKMLTFVEIEKISNLLSRSA